MRGIGRGRGRSTVPHPPIEQLLAPGGLSAPRPPIVAGPSQSPRQPGPGLPVPASPRPPMHPGSPMRGPRPPVMSPQMGLLGPRPSFVGSPRPSGMSSPRPPMQAPTGPRFQPGTPVSGSPRPGPSQPPGPPGPLPPLGRPPLHASTPIQTPVASSASVPPFMERPTLGNCL